MMSKQDTFSKCEHFETILYAYKYILIKHTGLSSDGEEQFTKVNTFPEIYQNSLGRGVRLIVKMHAFDKFERISRFRVAGNYLETSQKNTDIMK